MKRAGFTMIELIFVIVILGILAAVAIPKLSATRTDAQVSKLSSNLATVVSDLGSHYTSKGNFTGNWDDLTNVQLTSDNAGKTTASGTAWATGKAVYLGSGATAAKTCFSISATTDGNVSVTSLAAGTDPVCVGAQAAAAKNNLTDATPGTAKVHQFGGAGVSY